MLAAASAITEIVLFRPTRLMRRFIVKRSPQTRQMAQCYIQTTPVFEALQSQSNEGMKQAPGHGVSQEKWRRLNPFCRRRGGAKLAFASVSIQPLQTRGFPWPVPHPTFRFRSVRKSCRQAAGERPSPFSSSRNSSMDGRGTRSTCCAHRSASHLALRRRRPASPTPRKVLAPR